MTVTIDDELVAQPLPHHHWQPPALSPLVPLMLCGAVVVPLNDGRSALVDAADWPRVSWYRWTVTSAGKGRLYAKNDAAGYLHRFVTRAGPNQQVDHRDGNGLDNRRPNLRLCTNAQNSANQRPRGGTSRFKGVHWNRRQSVWVASIHAGYGTQFLGHFGSEEDAARRYDLEARKAYGKFARTNFPASAPETA